MCLYEFVYFAYRHWWFICVYKRFTFKKCFRFISLRRFFDVPPSTCFWKINSSASRLIFIYRVCAGKEMAPLTCNILIDRERSERRIDEFRLTDVARHGRPGLGFSPAAIHRPGNPYTRADVTSYRTLMNGSCPRWSTPVTWLYIMPPWHSAVIHCSLRAVDCGAIVLWGFLPSSIREKKLQWCN